MCGIIPFSELNLSSMETIFLRQTQALFPRLGQIGEVQKVARASKVFYIGRGVERRYEKV